ncbi:McrC family protein [Actinomycetospora sp. C-140]
MTVLDLVENGPVQEVALPDAVIAGLVESGAISATPTRRPGRWLVAARRVGVVAVDGVQVRVEPKVPVRRLLFLLGYARDPRVWRDPSVDLGTVDELLPALAHGFVHQTERALRRGVLHGYVERQDSLTVLRGRLRTADQLAQRHGLPLPLEVRYDEFVDDIAENRLLRTAAQVLAGVPRVPRPLVVRLRRLVSRLEGATILSRREGRPSWNPTRLNARYVPALRLAELVLDGASVEHTRGGTAITGFLVEPWRVFEDFMGVALREALAPEGGSLDLQSTRDHLDVARCVNLRPDMVWRRRGETLAVLDAKYKVETVRGVPDGDLYQMLAYCTALGLDRGYLLYARGLGPTREHVVRRAGVVLACRAIDLDQEPSSLLADIGGFAAGLADEVASRTSE